MTALLRLIFVVPLGFVAACVAAASVAAIAASRGMTPPPADGEVAVLILVTTIGVATIAFVPMLVAVVLAEAFGWRSVFYWLGVGAAIAIVAATPLALAVVHTAAAFALGLAGEPYPAGLDFGWRGSPATIALAAGFIGGFVYWLIAGRRSGAVKPTSSPSAPA